MVLFITRKHPPSVGGMQQLSYHLTQAISRRVPSYIIKWGGSQKWLPLFVPYALVRALLILGTKPVTLIHVGDPVLAPLGLLLRWVGRRPVVTTAHGLDVIYPNRLYQAVMPACVKRLDFVICISESTRQQCLARGVEAGRTQVIPVGVEPEALRVSLSPEEQGHWLDRWGLQPRPKHVLLTVGRLVPRKGVLFFVSQVLPEVVKRRDDCVYLVVGDGPERGIIEAAVRERRLDRVVRMLGQVPAEELQAAYAMADLFVMPNMPVRNDPEGFGIVTVEARAAGLRIVASAIEGIVDSFTSADDGLLVPPGDTEAFVEAIDRGLETKLTVEERERRRGRTVSQYGWTYIAEEYLTVFRQVQAQYHSHRNRAQRGEP
jgi:phosphatidylinositol alpha-1,6-mannosyltransferase